MFCRLTTCVYFSAIRVRNRIAAFWSGLADGESNPAGVRRQLSVVSGPLQDYPDPSVSSECSLPHRCGRFETITTYAAGCRRRRAGRPGGWISKGWKPLAMNLRPGRGEGDADSGPAQWWLEFGLGAPAGDRTQSLFMFLFALFFFFCD